jgi:hypothetical protein
MQSNLPMNCNFKPKYVLEKPVRRIVNEDLIDNDDPNEQERILAHWTKSCAIGNAEQVTLLSNRLSCKELERLKERYVDFLSPKMYSTQNDEYDLGLNLNSKTSKSCAQLAYAYQRALYSSKLDLNSDYAKLKPDPPQRTVSIRHSVHYSTPSFNPSEMSYTDDDMYSPFIAPSISSTSSSNSSSGNSGHLMTPVRGCKSTTSLNETVDDSSSSFGRFKNEAEIDNLTENEINRIRAMYQSIHCSVYVSQSCANFYTTHSEQIADLRDCWKLELGPAVPVLISDKRNTDTLKLLFVNKTTAFALCEAISITNQSQFKNPKEKRITFTVDGLICLVHFHEYLSCLNFFKFYRNIDLNLNQCASSRNNKSFQNLKLKFIKRQQKLKYELPMSPSNRSDKINKNFISSPCAFQHVNSIKNIDQNNINRITVKKP